MDGWTLDNGDWYDATIPKFGDIFSWNIPHLNLSSLVSIHHHLVIKDHQLSRKFWTWTNACKEERRPMGTMTDFTLSFDPLAFTFGRFS